MDFNIQNYINKIKNKNVDTDLKKITEILKSLNILIIEDNIKINKGILIITNIPIVKKTYIKVNKNTIIKSINKYNINIHDII